MKRLLLPLIVLAAIAALAVPIVTSEGLLETLSKARTDYIALQCLGDAMAAAIGRPVDRDLAARRLERAIELDPDNPTVVVAAPIIYSAIGDYVRSAQALARQTAPNPLLLGEALLMLGKKQAGTQILMDAAKRAKLDYSAGVISEHSFAIQLNNAAYTMVSAGVALEQAQAMLETATNILPLEYNCIDSLGWLYYREGDYHKATFYLERAARLQPRPGQPEILYHLGAAYAREGRHARAKRFLTMALRLDPQHKEARRELRTLQWLLPPPTLA